MRTAFLATARAVPRLLRGPLRTWRREARTDELTGVGNRRALLDDLAHAASRGQERSLLLTDLDDFKGVNDRYGHLAGDEVLRAVSATVQRLAPTGARVTRMGGDEFAVVLDADLDTARAFAERLVGALASGRGFPQGRGIGASVGVVHGPADPERLLHDADVAMYEAKRSGSCVVCYDERLGAESRERQVLADELQAALGGAALGRDQFVVWYQPQVSNTTGRVAGLEALVRWRNPRRGLVPPVDFLEALEQQHLMGRLTEHVLTCAVRDATNELCRARGLRMSVNLAPSVLEDASVVTLIDRVLSSSGLEPQDLVLEVTESALVTYDSLARTHAQQIVARGVGLSIDDYGTGYSSLSQLHHVPACELKLDRDFTRDLLTDERARVIVHTTIDLAHRLEMRVVAEGVEDLETLGLLTELGCDETQGWVHARAMPCDELRTWLTEREAAAAGVPHQRGELNPRPAPQR